MKITPSDACQRKLQLLELDAQWRGCGHEKAGEVWEWEGRLGKNEAETRTGVRSAGGEHGGSPESAHPAPSQQAPLKVPTRKVPGSRGLGASTVQEGLKIPSHSLTLSPSLPRVWVAVPRAFPKTRL